VGAKEKDMGKVSFSGLVTGYDIEYGHVFSPYSAVRIELRAHADDLSALAKFLNACLDDARTSTDRFTLTLESEDDKPGGMA
jgi:hypothetical protein